MVGGSMSLTVTLKLQLVVLPEASVAVQVTRLIPAGKAVPFVGLQIRLTLVQLSVAVASKVTTWPQSPGAVLVTMSVGHEIVGGSVSLTVIVKVQALVPVLASVPVQVTVLVPLGKVEPLAGTQMKLAPEQLSVTRGDANSTTCSQSPGAVLVTRLGGQSIAGGSLSLTVTLKVQVLVLPLASVAVQVTSVAPLGKDQPLAGAQTKPAPGQLSLTNGANATACSQVPGAVLVTMSVGQVMTGSSVSFTTTEKLQVAVFPAASVAVQFTAFVPLAKALPLVGVQLTLTPGQLSVAVAASKLTIWAH
jgi:hypothetical protein